MTTVPELVCYGGPCDGSTFPAPEGTVFLLIDAGVPEAALAVGGDYFNDREVMRGAPFSTPVPGNPIVP